MVLWSKTQRKKLLDLPGSDHSSGVEDEEQNQNQNPDENLKEPKVTKEVDLLWFF